MKEIKVKWIAQVNKPQFNKFTYTQEMVDNLIKNTDLPMNLYDFREFVEPDYLVKTDEYQEKLEKEPKAKVGEVVEIFQEEDDLFIKVKTENDDWYNEKVTFSIAMEFDDEIPGYGSYKIKRFYVSDEQVRGQLMTKMIKEEVKNMPEEELKAIKESEERLKKLPKKC
jgi:hypothetical protein